MSSTRAIISSASLLVCLLAYLGSTSAAYSDDDGDFSSEVSKRSVGLADNKNRLVKSVDLDLDDSDGDVSKRRLRFTRGADSDSDVSKRRLRYNIVYEPQDDLLYLKRNMRSTDGNLEAEATKRRLRFTRGADSDSDVSKRRLRFARSTDSDSDVSKRRLRFARSTDSDSDVSKRRLRFARSADSESDVSKRRLRFTRDTSDQMHSALLSAMNDLSTETKRNSWDNSLVVLQRYILEVEAQREQERRDAILRKMMIERGK